MSEDQTSIQERPRVFEAPESYEKAAREWLQWMEDRIKDVYEGEKSILKPGDADDLRRAWCALHPAFDGLVANFIEPMDGQRAGLGESGYHFLWQLMHASFMTGARTTLSETGKIATYRDSQASSSRCQQAAQRRAKLKEFMVAKYPGRWSASEKTALQIQTEFADYLGMNPKKLPGKWSETLANDLKELKKRFP